MILLKLIESHQSLRMVEGFEGTRNVKIILPVDSFGIQIQNFFKVLKPIFSAVIQQYTVVKHSLPNGLGKPNCSPEVKCIFSHKDIKIFY